MADEDVSEQVRTEPSQELRLLASKTRQFYCALRDEGMSESNAVMLSALMMTSYDRPNEDDR